jgi:hypothetical protein
MSKLRSTLHAHREFLLVLILFIVFRLMAILVFRPGGYLGNISDFDYYRLLVSFVPQGYAPLIDFWVEYPPIFPWLLVGLYRLSLLIPTWSEAGTWFFMLLSTFFALVEAGNLVLFYAISRRLHSEERAVRLCWIYALLLIPVLTLFMTFDNLVLPFLLLTILLTLDKRPIGGGIAAGLGFMTKLVPIVAVPAALQHMKQWSQRTKLLVALALTVFLIAAPFLVAGPSYFLPAFTSPMLRSTWETVWALIDNYYSFGVAGGWDRFDPAQAGAAQHPTRLPWTIITIGTGLFYLFLYTRRVDWSVRRKVVAFTALTLNLFILYSKGYSPQFLGMLLPFLILLIPGWRGIAYALLLSIINLVELPVYFVLLPDEHWLLAGTVLLRTLIVIVVSAEYAAQVYEWRVSRQWWRRIALAITALVAILGLIGAVAGFRAYSSAQYEASPHRPAMELVIEQATPGDVLVIDDQLVYEQLYPFLHRQIQVILLEPLNYLPPWENRLGEVVDQTSGHLWLYAPATSPLHQWLADHHALLASYDLEGWRLSRWDTR